MQCGAGLSAINRDKACALSDQGKDLINEGKPREAEKVLREAVKLFPELDVSWYNLGIALEDQGKQFQAYHAYHKALQLNPDNEDAAYNKNLLLLDMQKCQSS